MRNAHEDFETFLRKSYRLPYNDWSSLCHRDFDFVIRVENLQEDFAQMLQLLGIEQRRPVPWASKTVGKGRDFLSYYTPQTRRRAKWIFGPYEGMGL
jgi:hypothetical protein